MQNTFVGGSWVMLPRKILKSTCSETASANCSGYTFSAAVNFILCHSQRKCRPVWHGVDIIEVLFNTTCYGHYA